MDFILWSGAALAFYLHVFTLMTSKTSTTAAGTGFATSSAIASSSSAVSCVSSLTSSVVASLATLIVFIGANAALASTYAGLAAILIMRSKSTLAIMTHGVAHHPLSRFDAMA